MRSAWFLALSFVWIFAGTISAQPVDNQGTLSVNVVDRSRQPIRGASVRENTSGTRSVFMDRVFPTAVERGFETLFKPRDAERSSFISTIYCRTRASYSIKVSAPGYDEAIVSHALKQCEDEVMVELKRSGQAIPKFEPLYVLSGRLADQHGRPITARFSISAGGIEYLPKISKSGEYSAMLTPGFYDILFNQYGCTEFQIKKYKIRNVPRKLDLTADCEQ